MAKTAELKLEIVDEIVGQFATDVELVEVGPGVQVTVRCLSQRSVGSQGHFLMALEDHLRQALDLPIEIFLEPKTDSNALRQRREKLQDWVDRRGMLKKFSEKNNETS